MMRNPQTIAFTRRKLPHWEVTDGRYFVTCNLEGAIPKEEMEKIHKLAKRLTQDRSVRMSAIQRTVYRRMEEWLHSHKGLDYLTHPEVAAMVMEAIRHREDRGDWKMLEYTLMPNHAHLFFLLGEGKRLLPVMDNFKRWTGFRGNQILQRTGEVFWHREWFDRWSRSDEEDEKIRCYIRNNPVKAGLVDTLENWPYGSWSTLAKK